MILTLEVLGPQAAKLGTARRRTFTSSGGIIGRDRNSEWVLSHTKVSARHATLSYTNGVFYIEDTSTNGVFVNSPKNRLERGRPYPLRSGDRIYIDPYEIRVSVAESEGAEDAPGWASGVRSDSQQAYSPFGADDPFPSPGYPQSGGGGRPTPQRSLEVVPGQEVDPLKLLDPGPVVPPARKAPTARDLEFNSPVNAHYKPPAVIPPPPPLPTPEPSPTGSAFVIPPDYDPLKDDGDDLSSWEPQAPLTPPPAAAPSAPVLPTLDLTSPEPGPAPEPHPEAEPEPFVLSQAPPLVARSTPVPSRGPTAEPVRYPGAEPPPATSAGPPLIHSDLMELLAGAGLHGIEASSDLARSFGEILRVVVSGVMDVLRSRQQIKDEFRMRMTQFRPADNNPLKFSANVEDALHNLLVKRNAAYLQPVEAFEDAFDDLRNHQLAMLAGMRVAFESMLAQFNPDHLQAQFDRALKAGWALGMTSKMRYWELYRDRHEEIMKDPDTAFRKLFGEEFARAYEQQLQRLKAESQRQPPPAKMPRPDEP